MRQDDGGEGPGWGDACARDGKGGKGGGIVVCIGVCIALKCAVCIVERKGCRRGMHCGLHCIASCIVVCSMCTALCICLSISVLLPLIREQGGRLTNLGAQNSFWNQIWIWTGISDSLDTTNSIASYFAFSLFNQSLHTPKSSSECKQSDSI